MRTNLFSRPRGLTLSEVIVALGILAFVMLMIIGVFTALLKASVKNREQATAELLVEALLEKAITKGPPGWGVNGNTAQRLEAQLEQDGTQYFYQVTPVFLHRAPTHQLGTLYRVDVIVGWWTDGARSLEQSKTGFGNRFVKGSRTGYVGETP